ncbi:MAG: hypothetical protein PHE33_06135 [Bacteroidales bacterium]|nr:hypothetical protein [Bacteroidales bacterium]
MKKYFLVLILIITSFAVQAQFGYKNSLEAIDGVEIKYKVVNEKMFDKSSPAQLRLKLKNTNDYDIKLNFEVEYQIDFTKKYQSGNIEIDIPRKSAKTGKMHGLVFEIKSNNKNIFKSDDAEWIFTTFEVEKIEELE